MPRPRLKRNQKKKKEKTMEGNELLKRALKAE